MLAPFAKAEGENGDDGRPAFNDYANPSRPAYRYGEPMGRRTEDGIDRGTVSDGVSRGAQSDIVPAGGQPGPYFFDDGCREAMGDTFLG